jgi:hypothetical protein
MNGLGRNAVRLLSGLGLGALIVTGQPGLPEHLSLVRIGDRTSVALADDGGKGGPGRDILVFVDESGSTDRQFDVYRRALLERIIPGLEGGDRLRVAPIVADNSLVSSFMAEAVIPADPVFDGLSDNEIDYNSEIKKDKARNQGIRDQLLATLKKKLAKSGKAPYTDLFGASRMASQLFSADRRRPILVFLSDMQEDRGRFRYQTMKWGARDLKRVEKAYGFPDLKDVCVYVIGTRSPSIEKTRKMGEFWMSYFRNSGASIGPSQMGSMLVNWPPDSSCGKPRVVPQASQSWFDRLKKKI